MQRLAILLFLAVLVLSVGSARADSPDIQVRRAALRSVVYIEADTCFDGTSRGGSGFVFGDSGHVITAHHVVGGCRKIFVRYDGAGPGVNHRAAATVDKVYAEGDLAMLSVANSPTVPVLKLAKEPADKNAGFAGLGYQNQQPSSGDVGVTFSAGSDLLSEILPKSAKDQLHDLKSVIVLTQRVLRFNSALQPGMSGGPIIDSNGDVIGVVAGGLRAGAANASWGWPDGGISGLLRSTERTDQDVRLGDVFYAETDLEEQITALGSGRKITCGARTFSYRGSETFAVLRQSADDISRVEAILNNSMQPPNSFDNLKFDLWNDPASGATVVTPAGYGISNEGQVCIVQSPAGPFREVIWSADASGPQEIQQRSLQFETGVMGPRVPMFAFQIDMVLSTLYPQNRDNGMVFNRKAYIHAKNQPYPGMPPPTEVAHSFETLIANSGSFLGVGTINNDLPTNLAYCVQNGDALPGCPAGSQAYLREWTWFILATQLSTYPAT